MSATRRQFLRSAALGLGGLAIARVAAACGDNATGIGAELAGAAFETTSDSLILQVCGGTAGVATEVMVAVTVAETGALVQLAALALDDTGAGALAIDGLAPDTAYAIEIADGAPLVRARTAPRDDDARPIRLAISADVDPSPEFASPIWATLRAAAPEVYLSIGDFPYCDNGPEVAATVDAYRDRHRTLRTTPAIREFLASTATRAIYDDHEFHNDWDPHFVAAVPERYAAAMQVWDEFFPIRTANADDIRYRTFRWGANAEVFVLDCRRFRSANAAPDGPDKTMLGAAQRAWFIAALAASTAPFKLVLSSVPLDFGNGDDHWRAFAHERDAIFAATVGIPGVLWLSGDQHWFAAHRHAHGIREIQMGPVARGLGIPPDPQPAGVLFRSAQFNFALLDITPTTITVAGVAADGTQFYTETLTAADLTATA